MSDRDSRAGIAGLAAGAIVLALAIVAGLLLQSWGNELDAAEERLAARRPADKASKDRGDGAGQEELAATARAELTAIGRDLEATRGGLADIRPANPGTPSTPGNPTVSRADLPRAIGEQFAALKREAELREAKRLSEGMVGGATHTVDLLAAPLGLNPEQVRKMQDILKEEGEACRHLLETPDRGADYQAQAKVIVERTEDRIRPLMDEAQLKKYDRAGVDWWSAGLNYARPTRPKKESGGK